MEDHFGPAPPDCSHECEDEDDVPDDHDWLCDPTPGLILDARQIALPFHA
jgi:hypothetical protein